MIFNYLNTFPFSYCSTNKPPTRSKS